MMAKLHDITTFIREHRLFILFVSAGLLLNLYLLMQNRQARENFITCSTYDKGPLGTYGLYRDLEDRGIPVRRIKLPVYREIDSVADRQKTLVILSPLSTPNGWEWEIILDWVAKGNRLVTSGLKGLQTAGWASYGNRITTTVRVPSAPSHVLLPVDSVFPYDDTLSPVSSGNFQSVFGKVYKDTGTVIIRHFTSFSPDMLPFVTHGNKPTAVKKAVGRGEWIIFTSVNPFSNSVLRDTTWYRFATRLFSGDNIYSGRTIMFDEFHNGYRATRSFWQLLMYYEFDSGIIYLSILILLYLFLTGIRIVPPVARGNFMHMDALPGMLALSGLLIKFGAWTSLMKREAARLRKELTRKAADPSETFITHYLHKHALPPTVRTPEELSELFSTLENSSTVINKKDAVRIFNILMFMRKETRS